MMHSLSPRLRGLLMAAHGVPVVLRPSDEAPDVTLTAGGDGSLEAPETPIDLPAVIRVVSGDEQRTVRAEVLPGAVPVLDPRDRGAASAASRSAVVAGRVALVTGGAQGFGEEIVRALHASGAWVYIADLNTDGATALADELGERATAVAVNVADEDSVAAMARVVVDTTGGLDLVISNAGIARAGSVLEQPLAEFALSTDVNYVAFFLVTKHLGRILRDQHAGGPGWLTDIIQINSKSGLRGSNRNGAYAGSKFGGIGLVQSFALELVEHGVKVNAICPGNFLDGPLWSDPVKGLFVQYWKSGKVPGAKSVDDVRRHYEAQVPMRRGTFGADVMRAVYYLVEQAYETGQALPVTGGQVMLSS
ncbi:SDR family NAD(P)-dependent oxidoreductase [Tessaracoccus oleiagri]|uniref:Sorbitol-6-phosphate 2-dehydrogenase n=1 Tax=Tessaracoccus oleiagri TaxID=686624 RepID=A0A1G9IFQ2_9ACTN|nr:SDR family NAD(P)-dependent oxidoreductase [Tessaracoccus oleiagri]SDL24081.1 sorbitol-6-phosphate 2-dehydrogenase [Tessaracoccus oleiagri]